MNVYILILDNSSLLISLDPSFSDFTKLDLEEISTKDNTIISTAAINAYEQLTGTTINDIQNVYVFSLSDIIQYNNGEIINRFYDVNPVLIEDSNIRGESFESTFKGVALEVNTPYKGTIMYYPDNTDCTPEELTMELLNNHIVDATCEVSFQNYIDPGSIDMYNPSVELKDGKLVIPATVGHKE